MNNLTPGKIIGWIVVVFGAFALAGWGLGWFATPLEVTSVGNVRQQYAFAYQYDESLTASAHQYCTARDARDRATPSEVRDQRETQLIAIEQNYARIAAEYNAKLRDAFAAKYVKPADVPDRAPELADKVRTSCAAR